MIIGISGKKGSGKDTTADIICKLLKADKCSFARPLKNICQDLFEWDNSRVDGHSKEIEVVSTIRDWKKTLPRICRKHIKEFKCFSDVEIISGFKKHVLLNISPKYIWYYPIFHLKRDLTITASPRKIMQLFGTNFARKFDDNVWINHIIRKYAKSGLLVVSDVRFNNEANTIKNCGGYIFNINRHEDSSDLHSSESGISKLLINAQIYNKGSIKELERSISLIMKETIWNPRVAPTQNK